MKKEASRTGHVIFLFVTFISISLFVAGCGKRGDPVPIADYEINTPEIQKAETDISTDKEERNNISDAQEPKVEQPDAPKGLKALFTGSSVVLTWNEIIGQGVKVYKIYRSEQDDFVLSGESVTPAYTDKNIELKRKYIYKVSAVGISESLPSEEISVETSRY